jgi:DNA-binding HxlR family transcriptional regulator
MKRLDTKSHCPINYGLENFGDPWSLLIVRDIVYFGKKTYGEFLASEERIATNMLANRLTNLEERGIIKKCDCDYDKRKDIYELTEKGLDLIPILTEIALWGAQHDDETQAPAAWIEALQADKERILARVRHTVKQGGAVFVGPNSVIEQLKLG